MSLHSSTSTRIAARIRAFDPLRRARTGRRGAFWSPGKMCTKNDNPEYYFRDLLSATVQFLLVALILLGGKTVPVYASVSDTCASGLDPTEVFWPDAPA